MTSLLSMLWNSLFSTLLNSGVTLLILGGISYVARDYILSFLNKRLQHKHNKELEEIKASIRKNENEQNFIRNAALTAFSLIDTSVKSHRLNAIDKLWCTY